MRLTILGSFPNEGTNEYPLQGTSDNFGEACRAIGRRLGQEGQVVVVGTDSQESADYHVVKGIIDTAGGTRVERPLIHVLEAEQGGFLFENLWAQQPSLFTSHRRKLRGREAAKIVSVQESDAALAIGGQAITYRAGLATAVSRKRLVPIGTFGGAARQLLRDMPALTNSVDDDVRGVDGPWTSHLMERALQAVGVGKKPQLLIIHGHGNDRELLLNWLIGPHGPELPRPFIMGEEVEGSETMPAKFERLAAKVDAAIALATPDDVGRLFTEDSAPLRARARQNVWVEVGWFWGRLGRRKLMILSKGNIEVPSDLAGVELFSYSSDPVQASEKIRAFLDRIRLD